MENYRDTFTESPVKYNHWFIRLRYFAFASLIVFLASINVFFQISNCQNILGILVLIFIFIYNTLLKRKLDRTRLDENNSQQIAFYQIVLDILSLSVLVYATGGIEAPIFLFFIFHMILGSLLLPRKDITLIACFIVITFSGLSLLEYFSVIPHQEINGLFSQPLYNDINFVAGILIIFTSVIFISIYLTGKISGDLRERELQLKNAYESLRDAEASKQKYIMAVVHELKSPIAASISYIELIKGNYLGEVNEAVAEKLSKTRERLKESIDNINDILYVSKFKLLNKINKEKVDLAELIDIIIEKQQVKADKKNIKISFDRGIEAEEHNGDPILLNLAFSNLIGNAIKYTPEKGVVSIKLEEDKITISDDGIGIPANDIKKLFAEFYRASNAVKSKIEGTGTGLYLVKQIIEEHGGKIKVISPSGIGNESRPGTEFVIKLGKNN